MKKVSWGPPKIATANRASGTYGSFREFFQKSAEREAEQKQAESYLVKAMPVMVALLEYKMRNREPLVVMRPLRYQTSEIAKGDAIDDAFYNRNKDTKPNDKFTDVIKTIMPGTHLVLKSLDTALSEFVFEDAMGNEHAINFAERNNLLTQTSIFEETKSYLKIEGE